MPTPVPVPMADTAANILNRVAAEVGVAPVVDPYGTQEQVFVQLRYLLNTAGEELLMYYPWEQLHQAHNIVTQNGDSGDYPLPADFAYIMNQTGWERASNVPLWGPLSPQDWQYLLGRDLVSTTIYASFRLRTGQFSIFPQPPPENLDIHFEYVSKNWVQDGDDPQVIKEGADKNNDVPLYNRLLLSRYTKVKYLEAHGMDSMKAQDDFNLMFDSITGTQRGAEILSAGRYTRGVPYLDTYCSTPNSGYGVP